MGELAVVRRPEAAGKRPVAVETRWAAACLVAAERSQGMVVVEMELKAVAVTAEEGMVEVVEMVTVAEGTVEERRVAVRTVVGRWLSVVEMPVVVREGLLVVVMKVVAELLLVVVMKVLKVVAELLLVEVRGLKVVVVLLLVEEREKVVVVVAETGG